MISSHPSIVSARELPGRVAPAAAWSLGALAGRLVEISGSAVLTAAAAVIRDAQRSGMLAAWIGESPSCFFPPDVDAAGIDLNALPVVRAPDVLSVWRAADTLIRSGGFAVVVLDCQHRGELSLAVQTRLTGLAKQHNTALLWIPHKDGRGPRGSLSSLRVETEVRRAAFNGFICEIRALKDKRALPGWTSNEVLRGPLGLC